MTDASAPPDPRPELTLLAIDPGLTGALAFYIPVKHLSNIVVYDMPVVDGLVEPHRIRAYIEYYKPQYAIIERVGPMPRDGVRQAWRFSAAFTTVRVVCALSNVPIMLVAPTVWKKHFHLKGGPGGKEQARALAIQAIPLLADRLKNKKDAGRAEAALLSIYGFQTLSIKDDHAHRV